MTAVDLSQLSLPALAVAAAEGEATRDEIDRELARRARTPSTPPQSECWPRKPAPPTSGLDARQLASGERPDEEDDNGR